MNKKLLKAYKALPFGKEFIEWLSSKGVLDKFINEVSMRTEREVKDELYYPNRCNRENQPYDYINKSLWWERTSDGHPFWADLHEAWVSECALKGYKSKEYTFEVFYLKRETVSVTAFSPEEAKQLAKERFSGCFDTPILINPTEIA